MILDESFINRLYNQVKKLDMKGVKWLMTQADTKQIKEIFKEYHVKNFIKDYPSIKHETTYKF